MARKLGKFSFGTGDRFGFEGNAQLRALMKIKEAGANVTPVWNKSNREHKTVGTSPESLRKEADEAVQNLGYRGAYFVDADHITLESLPPYVSVSDFFTIDVAGYIGKAPKVEEKRRFLAFISGYTQVLVVPGIKEEIRIEKDQLEEVINTFLVAAEKAAEVYRFIRSKKQEDFIVEVSMDEVARPQTPVELFFALAALAFYKVPLVTIAPKFTGRFNKGIDYEGDLQKFEKEFEADILVLKYCIQEFGFPEDLKLSIHSGSDKFSIYPVMNRLIRKYEVGLHVKTAGTTWLEELTVLAESGTDGFDFAAEIYEAALERFKELTAPYPDVLDIDRSRLPDPKSLRRSGGQEMAKRLRHNNREASYNPHFRQLMHCAYKVAGEKQEVFFRLLQKYRSEVEEKVTENLYDKHLVPLFLHPDGLNNTL